MRRSPYRTAAITDDPPREMRGAWDDSDLVPVFGVVWALSLLRVVFGLLEGETFGAEASLAVLAVFLVPPMVWRSRRSRKPPPGR